MWKGKLIIHYIVCRIRVLRVCRGRFAETFLLMYLSEVCNICMKQAHFWPRENSSMKIDQDISDDR
jgi:hypothetical protein